MGIFSITKKKIAVGAAVATFGVGGVVAFAYWTTGGSGSGTATAGQGLSNLGINASVATPMVLNGGAQAVALSVTNGNGYHVDLVGDTAAASNYACNGTAVASTWFTLSSAAIGGTTVIPAGASGFAVTDSGLTLTMNDLATVDQDICQGAAITFSLAVTAEPGAH